MRERGIYLLDGVLRAYSQILFTRSWLVGALLLGATLVSPLMALCGLGGILLATATARLLNLSPDLIRSGLFGYNALLVSLGASAMYQLSPVMLGIMAVAVIGSVFVTAALHSALGSTWNLPVLTLPFLFIFVMLLPVGVSFKAGLMPLVVDPLAASLSLPGPVQLFLHSLGAIFFLPRLDAGLLVLLALLVYSRIGVLLAVFGFALSYLLGFHLMELPGSLVPMVLGYNFILTSLALGGVWFVPSLPAFLFAGVGVAFCGMITVGTLPYLVWNGLPTLILPFNLTVLLLLYAMRQRIRDGQPKSVDFLLGTPEENLSFFRTRLSRFGAHYVARFAAPYLGRWTCTQGVDGETTHQGPWRHAFDFEVLGPDDEPFKGRGKSLSDYLCYRLPVLATADGTVAKVVDGVKDNKLGEVNLDKNWGNLVILFHGPGVYSMVCHLSPESIKVKEGESVSKGDQLGLCGNSGRSPIPHIHFQLQATVRVGAPTIHAELHDLISEGEEGPVFHRTLIPDKGEQVRNLEPEEDLARMFTLTYGEELTFTLGEESQGGERARTETVAPDIDLYGNLLLRSLSRSTSMVYDRAETHFTVFDTLGRRGSVLHLIQAALARVPYESNDRLSWDDVLPLRHFLPLGLRLALDLVSPFVQRADVSMSYKASRQGKTLEVTGESRRRGSDGGPMVRTRALLSEARGIEELELTVRGDTRRAVRVEPETKNDEPAGR